MEDPSEASATQETTDTDRGAAPELGSLIGNYRLIELLGEGGFGAVYRAEQSAPVERQVAFKLIKLGMDTRQIVARFELEFQSLALMSHPGIAQVFDAGVVPGSGRPYFVMELVDGVPITDYCDRAGLDVRARLELFRDVCLAVQHAHQKGIVHRDIKPTNVLVTVRDGRPLPKVIDFGIAKAIDRSGPAPTFLTEEFQVVGTPEYMSPEQADPSVVDVDTRADVYSLGMILYELVTGVRPFELTTVMREGVEALLHHIREVDPPKPSTRVSSLAANQAKSLHPSTRQLRRVLRGDLDWIVMRALEKERERRYPSVAALADDVTNHLEDRPVSAGPPSVLYRFRKMARRNKVAVAGVVAVFLALAVGFGLSTREYLRAEEQRRLAIVASLEARTQAGLANAAAAEAREQREEADRQREEAQLRRDEAERERAEAERQARIATAINHFLNEDVLSSANPFHSPDPSATVRSVLERAGNEIDRRFRDEPSVAAALHFTVAHALVGLDRLPSAEKHLARSRELYGTLPRDERAERDLRFLEAAIRVNRGDLDEGLLRFEELLAEYRKESGSTGERSIQAAVTLVSIQLQVGRLAEARALLDELLDSMDALGAGRVMERVWIRLLDASYLQEMAEIDQAIERYLVLLDFIHSELGDNSLQYLEVMGELGLAYNRAHRFDEAEEALWIAFEQLEAEYGEEHTETLTMMNNLALVYRNQGRIEEAIDLHERDIEISTRKYGRDSAATLTSISNLGRLFRRAGRREEAIPLLREAAEGLLEHTPRQFVTGITLHVWGDTQFEDGAIEGALASFLAAHEVLSLHFEPDFGEIVTLRASIAACHRRLGDSAAEADWLR